MGGMLGLVHPTALLDSIAPDDRAPLARRLRFLLDALPPSPKTDVFDSRVRARCAAVADELDELSPG